ncbi:MAG: hypothetical protein K0S37_150 [Microbacterium sp.]|nr:hypothetical protein [Microbacterium sp.]
MLVPGGCDLRPKLVEVHILSLAAADDKVRFAEFVRSRSSAEQFDVSDRWDVPTCEARAPPVAHRWSGTNLIAGASYGRPQSSVPVRTIRFMGRRRSNRWVPPQPFSLEEAARGTDVRELEEPMPVYVWFQLPDRLIRRDDAIARSMTRDAVWVEAGRGETKLAAWV